MTPLVASTFFVATLSYMAILIVITVVSGHNKAPCTLGVITAREHRLFQSTELCAATSTTRGSVVPGVHPSDGWKKFANMVNLSRNAP